LTEIFGIVVKPGGKDGGEGPGGRWKGRRITGLIFPCPITEYSWVLTFYICLVYPEDYIAHTKPFVYPGSGRPGKQGEAAGIVHGRKPKINGLNTSFLSRVAQHIAT
jgi:hypothetical protein